MGMWDGAKHTYCHWHDKTQGLWVGPAFYSTQEVPAGVPAELRGTNILSLYTEVVAHGSSIVLRVERGMMHA